MRCTPFERGVSFTAHVQDGPSHSFCLCVCLLLPSAVSPSRRHAPRHQSHWRCCRPRRRSSHHGEWCHRHPRSPGSDAHRHRSAHHTVSIGTERGRGRLRRQIEGGCVVSLMLLFASPCPAMFCVPARSLCRHRSDVDSHPVRITRKHARDGTPESGRK